MCAGFAVPGIDFVGSQASTQPVSTITQLDDDDDVVVDDVDDDDDESGLSAGLNKGRWKAK